MAYLLNRVSSGRLRCLHYLLKLVNGKFQDEEFTMGDLLFDSNDPQNIHAFCELLKWDKNLNMKYCPFLKNPLSEAGCYLTRGVKDDTTKRKEISNAVNSLDALGLITRRGKKLKITALGKNLTGTSFNSAEWLKIIRKAVCNYGLAVGVLYQLDKLSDKKEVVNTTGLIVGYPDTREVVEVGGKNIKISSGSTRDSNTRTKSCILAWLTTAGFFVPKSLISKIRQDKTHIDTNDYILSSVRSERIYKKNVIPKEIFSGEFITERPLSFDNLTKSTAALREHGQRLSRMKTMEYESIIKNRRFAIIYVLDYAFKNKKVVDFIQLKDLLRKHKKLFVINAKDFDRVMSLEIKIGLIAGIPFEIIDEKLLKPITGLNKEVFCYGAPLKLINLLDKELKKIL